VSRPPLALNYHGVERVALRDDIARTFVHPDLLRRQIEQLRAWGYELLGFSAWAERVTAGQGSDCAAITFDDGYSDNLEVLAPLLDDLQAPATVFVVSGWLGQRHPHTPRARVLTTTELAELHAAGVEIGLHTRTHPDLTLLSPEAVREELVAGRTDLEDILGVPIKILAYPYGSASAETIEIARSSGFAYACRTSGMGGHDDPLDLQRQDMGNHSSMLGLRLKRDDRYMPLMRFRPVRGLRRVRLACVGARLRRP
jgi:peptidoglycan/xylan/chitin deacetylase (PgdA/CDA1 family)